MGFFAKASGTSSGMKMFGTAGSGYSPRTIWTLLHGCCGSSDEPACCDDPVNGGTPGGLFPKQNNPPFSDRENIFQENQWEVR